MCYSTFDLRPSKFPLIKWKLKRVVKLVAHYLWNSKFCLTILFLLPFIGCKTLLLPKSELVKISGFENEDHFIIYYSEHYTNTAAGELYHKTHRIIKIGSDVNSQPEYFSVFDGSNERLQDFEARLIKTNGDEITYSENELSTAELSNKYVIVDARVKYLPISEFLNPGDILEMVSIHKFELPALGIQFSLGRIGLKAANINFSIQIPSKDSIIYNVVNDTISPIISKTENSKTYTFYWQDYAKKEKKNIAPALFIGIPRYFDENSGTIKSIKNWKDFGGWYYNLLQPKLQSNKLIDSVAFAITQNAQTPKDKMDQIFIYCQSKVRYEQVYLSFGEFIPNECSLIFNRKYGDCKDYSTLIYTMAASVGLEPHFALCYRGRGRKLYEDVPVSQFNHVIIHYKDNGNDYWYDGTNRTGIPGITTVDLLNHPALIIKKNNSHFITIKENEQNNLVIKGNLTQKDKGLNGNINISFYYQFAIDFFYFDNYKNATKMKDYLIKWIKTYLSGSIIVKNIEWIKKENCFDINFTCELPNTILELDNKIYLSFRRLFPNLLSNGENISEIKDVYYFKDYNKVEIELDFQDMQLISDIKSNSSGKFNLQYSLPAGPFNNSTQKSFLSRYKEILETFNNKYIFKRMKAL